MRDTHTAIVDAETPEEAERVACESSYMRHKRDVYAIKEIEQVSGKVHIIFDID